MVPSPLPPPDFHFHDSFFQSAWREVRGGCFSCGLQRFHNCYSPKLLMFSGIFLKKMPHSTNLKEHLNCGTALAMNQTQHSPKKSIRHTPGYLLKTPREAYASSRLPWQPFLFVISVRIERGSRT